MNAFFNEAAAETVSPEVVGEVIQRLAEKPAGRKDRLRFAVKMFNEERLKFPEIKWTFDEATGLTGAEVFR